MVDETATNKQQVSQKSFFHRSELFSNRIGIYRGMYFERRSNDVLRGPGPMLEPMDIFKMREDGTYLWRGAAQNLDLAKSKVQQLAITAPGPYMIYSQITGEKTVLPLDAT